MMAMRAPTLAGPRLAAPGEATAPITVFRRLKTIAWTWGALANGSAANETWLTTDYDHDRYDYQLDHMISTLGCRRIGLWLALDALIDKTSFGTRGWTPVWNSYIANLDDVLTMIRGKGAEVIVSVFHSNNFDSAALTPDWRGPMLCNVGLQNGGMETATGGIPDSWTSVRGGASNTRTWQAATGSPPSGAPNEFVMGYVSGAAMFLDTPRMTWDRSLARVSVDLKCTGFNVAVWVMYYTSGGQLVQSQSFTVTDPAGAWTTFTAPTLTGLVSGAASKVAIQVKHNTVANLTVTGGRIGYADPSAKYYNYIDALKALVRRYNEDSPLGRAISGWVVYKEGYSNEAPDSLYQFQVDAYNAIRSVSRTQPVLVDAFSGTLQASPAADIDDEDNQPYYSNAGDVISLHAYDDQGDLPATSHYKRPLVLGEVGSDSDATAPDGATNKAAVQAYANAGRGLFVMPFQWVGRLIDRSAYPTLVLGQTATWIRDEWVP